MTEHCTYRMGKWLIEATTNHFRVISLDSVMF